MRDLWARLRERSLADRSIRFTADLILAIDVPLPSDDYFARMMRDGGV